MPSPLTDATLIKLVHLGWTDKQIAEKYGITPQAVNKRLHRLGLKRRSTPLNQMHEILGYRWKIKTTPYRGTHHSRYSAKRLKLWLRCRLGDDSLSEHQIKEAKQWERRIRNNNEVLCYDPESEDGWYYRPRTEEDGRLVIDWPKDLPFPDDRSRKALELPDETTGE